MLDRNILVDEIERRLAAMGDDEVASLEEENFAPCDYEEWLRAYFPESIRKPLAPRHHRLYQWFDGLKMGECGKDRVECWARGGGKSSTVENGVVLLESRQSRKFCLYCCGTQAQANKHVTDIARKFETIGTGREVNDYGTVRGWRQDLLITDSGFAVAAFGLDSAIRGIKIGDFRPDIIILDDTDAAKDSSLVTANKIEAIKAAIFPSGSDDCVVLFVQNMVHDDSMMARLYDGRADYLLDAEVMPLEPALKGLKVEAQKGTGGKRNWWKIIAGTPTWEGQDIDVCQRQLSREGLYTFLAERQHEVQQAAGSFFNTREDPNDRKTHIPYIAELPTDQYGNPVPLRACLSFDLAATEGGGDYFARLILLADDARSKYILYKAKRNQWGSEKVRKAIHADCAEVRGTFPDSYRVTIPQDPAQAGKAQKESLEGMLIGFNVTFVNPSGKKSVRARSVAEQFNLRNIEIMRDDEDDPWNEDFIFELKRFTEDDSHDHDDWVDCFADAFNELQQHEGTMTGGMVQNKEVTRSRKVSKKPWFEVKSDERLDEDDEWDEVERVARDRTAFAMR